MDQTKRGEQERQEDMKEFEGEPVGTRQTGPPNAQPTTVTRDKGVKPSEDRRRDGRGESEGE